MRSMLSFLALAAGVAPSEMVSDQAPPPSSELALFVDGLVAGTPAPLATGADGTSLADTTTTVPANLPEGITAVEVLFQD